MSHEKHMATLQGSLEDAQRAQLDTITVQVSWNLRQIRLWMQEYDYSFTPDQQAVWEEIDKLQAKEAHGGRTD
jgi:RecG-like helicase